MDEQFLNLFKIQSNRKSVEAGNILMAEPFMLSREFARSVVFIAKADTKGAIGFILNRPIGSSASEAIDELEGIDLPIYVGGPMDMDRLFYVHTHSEVEKSVQIADGIYWGGDYGQLMQGIREGDILRDEICLFVGYSGWASRQLEKELNENSWMVGEITSQHLFDQEREKMWEREMRKLGEPYSIWANFPISPLVN